MKIITFATQKGGSGKSTLCMNCAVAAAAEGAEVAILDTDPQGTLMTWARNRGDKSPTAGPVSTVDLPPTLARLREAGCDYVFIDTRSGDDAGTNAALRAADFILVPTRTSHADVWAVLATIQALRRLGKPFAVAINQTPPVGFRIVETRAAATELGKVVPNPLVMRNDHQDAMGRGLGVTEYNASGKAAAEIRQMWDWIKGELGENNNGKTAQTAT